MSDSSAVALLLLLQPTSLHRASTFSLEVSPAFENQIRDQGAGWLAKVLPQCPALSYLNISSTKEVGTEAADRLRAVWSGEPIHLVL